MAEELRREREASSLDLEELTNFLDGDENMTERRREICELICEGGGEKEATYLKSYFVACLQTMRYFKTLCSVQMIAIFSAERRRLTKPWRSLFSTLGGQRSLTSARMQSDTTSDRKCMFSLV